MRTALSDSSSSEVKLRDAWTRYWAAGAAHSCAGSYGDAYAGSIASFWRQVFDGLPQHAWLLDLATGGGALPRLLLQHRAGETAQCDAVDVAAIEPGWASMLGQSQRQRLRFHPGVNAASLPFEDDRFDLVISQYGIEYAPLSESIPELLRVLAPGGSVSLVLHHANSRPVQLAHVELEHLEWLATSGGFFDSARELIEPMARAATAAGRSRLERDTRANLARERFNALLGALSRRASEQPDGADVLFEVRESAMALLQCATHQGQAAAEHRWHKLRSDHADLALRLQDLRRHALNVNQVGSLYARLAAVVGGGGAVSELHEGPHLMGWAVTVRP